MVRLAPGVSRETATRRPERGVSAVPRRRQDPVGPRPCPGVQVAGPCSLVIRPSEFRDRYGKPVQAMLAIVVDAPGAWDAPTSPVCFLRARGRAAARSLGLPGARRQPTRLARQLLSETLVISMAGGALGVLAASWGVDALVAFLPGFGASTDLQIRPDRNVLLFGLLRDDVDRIGHRSGPGLARPQGRHPRTCCRPADEPSRSAASRSKRSSWCRSRCRRCWSSPPRSSRSRLSNLKTQSLGFVADGVLTLTVDADGTGFEGERLSEVHRQMLERLRALPGVQHASFATIPPLSSNEDGKPFSIPGVDVRVSRRRRVAGEYGGPGLLRNLRRAHLEGPRHHRVRSPVSTTGRRRQREHGALLLPRPRPDRPAHGRRPGSHWRTDRDCRDRGRCSLSETCGLRHPGWSMCRHSSAKPKKRTSSPSAPQAIRRCGQQSAKRETPGHRSRDSDNRRQNAGRPA